MPAPLPIASPQFVAFMALAFLFAGTVFRFRLKAPREAASGRRAPLSILGIAIQALAIGLVGFGPVAMTLLPGDWRSVAATLAVLLLNGGAVWLFAASAAALGANWSLVARTRSDHSLVRDGPFAQVRHPIYAAMLLFMLGLAVATGHEAHLLIALPLFLIGTLIRIQSEERLLRAQFGAAYDEYAREVPALIPRP